LAALLCALCVSAGTATAAVPDDAVAVVNGEPIPRAEFGQAMMRAVWPVAFASFVDCVLIEQEAQKKGVTVTDQEIQERRELELRISRRRILESFRMSEETFRRLGAERGWTEDYLREQIEAGLTERALRMKLLTEKLLRPYVEVAEDEVRQYYGWTLGERYALAHVLVGSEPLARLLMERLSADPGAWHAAVLQLSLDRASVPHEGRLRPVPVASRLGKVLKGMQAGDMGLYRDGESWHVLRFIGSVPASDQSFEQVKEELRAEVYSRKIAERTYPWLARLNERACVVANLHRDEAQRRALGKEVAAFVNGEPVYASTFAEALTDEFGERFIWPYVDRTLILQEAQRQGVTVSDGEVEERLASIEDALLADAASRGDMSREQFETFLDALGVEAEQYKQAITGEFVAPDDVRAALVAERIVAEGVVVAEEDIQRAYADSYGERMDVRELVVRSVTDAEGLYRKLAGGADFGLLVATESIEPLAWMHKGLVPGVTASHPYHEHVKDLEVGALSNVFERRGRYCLLKVIARHPAVDPPPLDSVRDELRRQVRDQKTRSRIVAWLEKLKAESQIEIALR